MGIEGVPGVQRIDAGLADEFRRHPIGLTEPEGEDVGATHAGVCDLADLRGAKAPDNVAREGRVVDHDAGPAAATIEGRGDAGREPVNYNRFDLWRRERRYSGTIVAPDVRAAALPRDRSLAPICGNRPTGLAVVAAGWRPTY